MNIEPIHFSHQSFGFILFIVNINHGSQRIQTISMRNQGLVDQIAFVKNDYEGFEEVHEVSFRKLWIGQLVEADYQLLVLLWAVDEDVDKILVE